jgi:glutamate decarboxylase
MHYSLEKGADLLGLGTDALIRVPVDRDGRMRVHEVRRTLAACRARGDVVIALVGVAGTTDTGAIDPLVELGAIAREAGIHFHVDAAWAGPILFSPLHRHKLAGIELADSVTIDGHKQLYLPMGVGMLALRDPDAARVIEKQAQYIIRADSVDLGRRSLEGSRPGMALYLHAALHILGASGYAWLLDEGIRKAAWTADRLRAHAEFELLAEPQTHIVNYRYVPPPLRDKARRRGLDRDEQDAIGRLNQRLQERQKADGTTFVSRTTLRHTAHGDDLPIVSLRAVLANPLTTESHIDRMLELQTQIATSLMA